MTENGNTIVADATNPDLTVICSFLDLDNGYEDFALLTLGQNVATSPRLYNSGTRLLVTATLTKNDNTKLSMKQTVTLTGTQVIPFKLVTAAGGNVEGEGVFQNDENPDDATFRRRRRSEMETIPMERGLAY